MGCICPLRKFLIVFQPKYISKILQKADIRNLDMLRATDRKYEKEKQKDQEQFADKQAYVTSA